jgi:hypothetical protein
MASPLTSPMALRARLLTGASLLFAVTSAHAVLFQAENYAAFYDTTPGNSGGAYRNDAVDIEATSDSGGGHNVGWIDSKEWLTYNNLSPDIYQEGAIVTADTGFANEANMKYLHENRIDGYIPDNRFRSRDPRFNEQKTKYGKRHAGDSKRSETIPASEFDFDPVKLTCRCPADQMLTFNGTRMDAYGNLSF